VSLSKATGVAGKPIASISTAKQSPWTAGKLGDDAELKGICPMELPCTESVLM